MQRLFNKLAVLPLTRRARLWCGRFWSTTAWIWCRKAIWIDTSNSSALSASWGALVGSVTNTPGCSCPSICPLSCAKTLSSEHTVVCVCTTVFRTSLRSGIEIARNYVRTIVISTTTPVPGYSIGRSEAATANSYSASAPRDTRRRIPTIIPICVTVATSTHAQSTEITLFVLICWTGINRCCHIIIWGCPYWYRPCIDVWCADKESSQCDYNRIVFREIMRVIWTELWIR